MTEPNAATAARGTALRALGVVALAGLVLGIAAIGACGWGRNAGTNPDPNGDPQGKGKEPTVGSLPLFHGWPKDQKPDATIVLSGQSFGLIQPCGCSRPQMGGLERRAAFLNTLRTKGWPLVGVDLGDLYPQKSLVADQAKLKYRLAMNALRDMGYVAVGLGKGDFAAGIDNILAEYVLQKEQPPFVLAGNLQGVVDGKPQPREERFPKPPGAIRPMVGLAEVAEVGGVPVGVAAVVGTRFADEVKKLDPGFTFEDPKETLRKAVAGLDAHPRKPKLNVLLFAGPAEDAKKLAADWPQFRVVLCQAEDPEPPSVPETANGGRTLVVQVGHKGRYIGLVGAFKRADGTFDLKYQLVPLGEEYITPGTEEAARKANPVLPLLEGYAEQVRDRNFLAKVPKTPHPAQIQEPKLNLSFVGSEKCQACHAAQFARWKETPHSHALDALEKIAKRPSLRNFDGECVQCHVVGLLHKTGYEDQKSTPQLAHVGCESCHGPGSGHAASEKNATLLALQSAWKQKPADRLPDVEVIKKIGALPPLDRGKVALRPEETRVINAVSSMCAKCHDGDNDPNFDIFTYWPKINHTFPKK